MRLTSGAKARSGRSSEMCKGVDLRAGVECLVEGDGMAIARESEDPGDGSHHHVNVMRFPVPVCGREFEASNSLKVNG